MSKPFLSLVLAARNDNYGGNFTERLQTGIDWNTRWLEQFKVTSEVIIVNWNPVAENPDLIDLITFPKGRKYVNYRIITVPNSVHEDYVDPAIRSTVPMFEFIAKNVGIRRAKGQYLLCINADILVHPEIFDSISKNRLDNKHYYRANRLDYRKTSNQSIPAIVKNGFAISLKGKMYFYNDVLNKTLQYNALKLANIIWLKWELFKRKHHQLFNRLSWNVVYDNGAFIAHCLNSGDFMLMATSQWFKLKGYQEYTYISTHTDSVFTIIAYAKLKEKVFKQPIFHQEHERRYSWEAIKNDPKFEKAYRLFEDVANDVKAGNPVDQHLNSENWGLSEYKLIEQQL